MELNVEQIRAALKKVRKERKLTQSELATLLGVSPQQYTNLEGGVSEFSLPQFVKIMQFFELSLIDLAVLIEPDINTNEFELTAIKSIKNFIDKKIKELEAKFT